MKSDEKFGVVSDYWKWSNGTQTPWDCRIKNGSTTWYRETFIPVLENEYALRELVQRIKFLREKIQALEKIADLDQTQLAQLNAELEQAQKNRAQTAYQLYRAESLLGDILKKKYDSLRQDPSWYMRQDLIQDCKDRGGCCNRACGCCSQRCLTSKETKGVGHCTWDCRCCVYYRGFEISAEEKERARVEFGERLRSWNASFLLRMTNGFFTKAKSELESEPQPQPESKPEPKPRPQTRRVRHWIEFWKR